MLLLLVCICKCVIGNALHSPYHMQSINQAVEYIWVFSLWLVIYCIRKKNHPGKSSSLLGLHDISILVWAQKSHCKHYRINLTITIINLPEHCQGVTLGIGKVGNVDFAFYFEQDQDPLRASAYQICIPLCFKTMYFSLKLFSTNWWKHIMPDIEITGSFY